MTVTAPAYRIGIDVGGTFTDVVLIENATGNISVSKILNRSDRAETVADAVSGLLARVGASADDVGWINHGTTIATNAAIERNGARTALVTNRNFRDILEIGRFARPPELIYRVHQDKPTPLVPRYLRLGVGCRIDRTGAVVTGIDEADLERAIATIRNERVESVAVCFLFSFLNPVHELQVRARLQAAMPELEIVLSSDVLREFREFPRTATTVFAAYVAPVLRSYVSGLVSHLKRRGIAAPLYLFQSGGGVATPEIVTRNPALTMLSGPAGAVVGAAAICGQSGYRDFITMDMGGTSLDTCLVRGSVAEVTTSREIDMFPVAVPMIDVHTIGAGGGSVVRIDEVGRVRIGPDSMGARPGPASYGLGGDRATLTDVNVVMGLINPDGFANGEVSLDPARAERVVEQQVAVPLSVGAAVAATGVYRVATSQIAEAIGTVTTEQGRDPRDFDLVAFGGSGPLYAAAVARELGIRRIVVPCHPGLFSARGIATADFVHDYIQSIVRPIAELDADTVVAAMSDLVQRADLDLELERIPGERRALSHAFDLRYVGQSTEITVPLPEGEATLQKGFAAVIDQFHEMHERLYSYSVPGEPVELVNLRLHAVGRVGSVPISAPAAGTIAPAVAGERRMILPNAATSRLVPVYQRDRLGADVRVVGPALIEEPSSATLVLAQMQAAVDGTGNLILTLDPKVPDP